MRNNGESIELFGNNLEENLQLIKNNPKINNLILNQFTLENDFSLLLNLNQVTSLILKDSYVNFKNFYTAVCNLTNLEKLAYNDYCFFEKNEKEKLSTSLKLPTLKVFKLEFSSKYEPDFEVSGYSEPHYKNKKNSITELNNFHKVFPNLEEMQFINYETYRMRMEKQDEYTELNSSIYLDMNFNALNKFKSLKKITINDGKPSSLISTGAANIIKSKEFTKTDIIINEIKEADDLNLIYKNNKELNITFDAGIEHLNVSSKEINNKIFESLNNLLPSKNPITINQLGLHDINYGEDDWEFKKDKLIPNIINDQIETIIFSDTYKLVNSYDNEKKLVFFLKLLSSIKNLKHVIFDFKDIEDSESKRDFAYYDIEFLKNLLYQLNSKKLDVHFYLYSENIKEVLENKKNSFEIHLVYLINFFINNNFFNHHVKFVGFEEKELISFVKNYINKIEEVYVIDDYLFNNSKRFPDQDILYSEQIDNLKDHYNFSSDIDSVSLENAYYEILRIASLQSNFTSSNKLLLLIKKKNLHNLKNFKFKKYYSYIGNTWHHINTAMDHDRKNLKIDKLYDDGSDAFSNKLYEAAGKVVDGFINSNELQISNNTKDEFLKPLDTIKYVKESGLDRNALSELTDCWFEGVTPWMGKYIKLSKLNDLIPTENLQRLILSDCLAQDDLELPYLPKLKDLKLHFFTNHHDTLKKDETKLKNFENLPNLEILDIGGLFNHYNSKVKRVAGISWFNLNDTINDDRWAFISVDFSNLEKLKTLKCDWSIISNFNKTVSFPSLESLDLKLFYQHEKMGGDKKSLNKEAIVDNDFLFLKKSKLLKNLDLRIGDTEGYEHDTFLECIYKGNGDFLNYISHNVESLKLRVNLSLFNQLTIQDIINKICNKFLKLKHLYLYFQFPKTEENYNYEKEVYKKKIEVQNIDFKTLSKLKNLNHLDITSSNDIDKQFNIRNFQEIINLKKLKFFINDLKNIPFKDLKKTRELFKKENYEDKAYYNEDCAYMDEEELKNWTRFGEICTDEWDYTSFESVYLEIEKEENRKKYKKPKQVIKRKKNKKYSAP